MGVIATSTKEPKSGVDEDVEEDEMPILTPARCDLQVAIDLNQIRREGNNSSI